MVRNRINGNSFKIIFLTTGKDRNRNFVFFCCSQNKMCIRDRIDYEDTDAVQFMYRFYNKVRKLGFSKELLETYIQTKRQKEYYDIEAVSYTHLFI